MWVPWRAGATSREQQVIKERRARARAARGRPVRGRTTSKAAAKRARTRARTAAFKKVMAGKISQKQYKCELERIDRVHGKG